MFGAVILMISNILVKVIGALFKIPLQNLIQEEGMAYFQAAYNIYVSFYMISTAGIPVAISRMIATSNAKGNVKEVKRIFKIAFWVFFVVGALATIIMMAFSKTFAAAASLDGAEYAMLAIAPTLFFICLSSAYRGYFQGLQNMVPTGVSQVIESVGKLSIGLIAGWYFISKGYPMHIVAAYVISGVTIGVIAATIYIMIFKRMFALSAEETQLLPVRTTKDLFMELVIISIPISLASSIMGLTNVVDTMLVVKRLTETATVGITDINLIDAAKTVAIKSYGTYAMPQTLFNMPTTLIYPFAISALPALSKYYGSGETEKSKKLMESTFRMSAIVALPCALGISSMSRPILSLIYNENPITDGITNIDLATPALMILGLSVFFLGMIAVTNSVLQAYCFQNHTIISTVCGIIVKIISTYFLLGTSIGLTGAAVGTALCYLTILILNMYFIAIKVKYFPSIRRTFLKPFIAAFICIIPCVLLYKSLNTTLGNNITTIVSILFACVVYIVMLLLLKGISEEDIKMLPKSEKIIKILKKGKLISE